MSESTIISVHVTPRSGRDEVSGVRVGAGDLDEVCVRVTAPPEGGKANKAVCKAIASSLGIPKTAVSVEGGQSSRRKRVSVGAGKEAVDAWMTGLPRR